MRRVGGLRVLTWVGRAAIKPHCQLLPRVGEKRLVVERRDKQYLCVWRKYYGWEVVASRLTVPWGTAPVWLWLDGD